MSNGRVPWWLWLWLGALTVVAAWVVWWSLRASNWSERAMGSIEARDSVIVAAYEKHTHTVIVGNQTLQTSPAGPITWPVETWPPEKLKFP